MYYYYIHVSYLTYPTSQTPGYEHQEYTSKNKEGAYGLF
jgi:hypothetical protein